MTGSAHKLEQFVDVEKRGGDLQHAHDQRDLHEDVEGEGVARGASDGFKIVVENIGDRGLDQDGDSRAGASDEMSRGAKGAGEQGSDDGGEKGQG